MPSIRILTDSTADLSPELLAANDVRVVPLLVQFGEESFQDGVDMDTDRLFRTVAERNQLPKTASPAPAVFRKCFEEAAADGSQVLFIGISSQFSATLQNAQIAASEFPEGQVRVFDSRNLSTGIGLQVLHACDLVRQGKSMDEIIADLETYQAGVRTSFVIDTMEYLHKGGRCSGVAALVGTLLKIRPVISVVDGGMIVAAKIRGTRKKALDWMLERFAEDVAQGRVRPERVFVTSPDSPHEDAPYMVEAVRRIMPEVQEVLVTRAGAVIGSHCGPGTIGILYATK